MTEIEENANMSKEEEETEKEESAYNDPNGKFSILIFRHNFHIKFVKFLLKVAVIVSFLEQFGALVFPDKIPIISDLMDWITNRDEVSQELVDLHVKLLRKLKRSVNPEKWEKAIVKFCYFYGGNNDAFELERFGM